MADALAQWLDEMEARAEKATPGPWEPLWSDLNECCEVFDRVGEPANRRFLIAVVGPGHDGRDEGNADYIAAWSPDVARAVLAVVRDCIRRPMAATGHGVMCCALCGDSAPTAAGIVHTPVCPLAALRRIVEKAPEAR